MFNPSRKQEFIDSYTGITSYNYINNLFNKSKPMEISLDKDVCDFTKPEILDLFASFMSYSENTLSVYKSILKQYTDFCCNNNLSKDNINHFEEVTRQELKKCVNQFFKQKIYISKEKLNEFCMLLNNPCDAFILYCLFEGVKGEFCEEITEMKMGDIDKKNKRVYLCTGRTISVSSDFIKIAEISNKQIEYKTPARPYTFSDSSARYILKTKFDRSSEDMVQKRARIFKKITNIKSLLDAPEISIPNLYNSGFLYYLLQYSKDENNDIEEVMEKQKYIELCEKYNFKKKDVYSVNLLLEKYLGAE